MAHSFLYNLYHGFVRSKNTLVILVFLFASITYMTTFKGVITYIFGSIDETPVLYLVIYAVVLLGLQMFLLIISTFQIIGFRKNTFISNLIWLPIFLFVFTFSATFSYTFWFDQLSADAHATRVLTQQVNKVEMNVEEYLNAFNDINNEMMALASYSNETAKTETDKGGTCGDGSPPGDGPRKDYRLQDADVFTQQAKKVAAVNKQIKAVFNQFKQQKLRFDNGEITRIPDLEEMLNRSVVKLNRFNSKHTVIVSVLKKLKARSHNNRFTGSIDKQGNPIFCKDTHIDDTVDTIKQKIASLKPTSEVKLFDRANRRELQNRVVEVFMSPFLSKAERENNNFSVYDYIALALGFLIETLLFVISVALHNGDNSYHIDRYGYVGTWFTSHDALQLKKMLRQDKDSFYEVINSAKKHQLGHYILTASGETINPIIYALDKRKLFNKKLNGVQFKHLPKKIKSLEQYADEDRVNLYYSPNKKWGDFCLSVTHMQEEG